MTNEKQPSKPVDPAQLTSDSNDWFQQFSKHLDENFASNGEPLPFEPDIPAYQLPTLHAVLQTLIDSGMATDSVLRMAHEYVSQRRSKTASARQFGLGKNKLKIIEDDDEHLEHFKDYMP